MRRPRRTIRDLELPAHPRTLQIIGRVREEVDQVERGHSVRLARLPVQYHEAGRTLEHVPGREVALLGDHWKLVEGGEQIARALQSRGTDYSSELGRESVERGRDDLLVHRAPRRAARRLGESA